ncbi:MAG: double zinc ribbon domain-containing protein, partial [Magnetospirillum sp. WYHS-4]
MARNGSLLHGGILAQGARRALDLLLPPLCHCCGTPVGEGGILCPACWATLEVLAPPHCAACGLPFEHDVGDGALCGACLRRPPVWR